MLFFKYPLTNRGYETLDGWLLPDIFGLDNLPPQDGDDIDLRFVHRGWAGYPDGAVLTFDSANHTETLAVFEDGSTVPDGGAEVATADVCALFMAEYGWRSGTVMGEDGMPVEPGL